MLPPTKCLFASLYTIITFGLVYCSEDNAIDTSNLQDLQSSQPSTFSEDPSLEADKRKWSSFASWGKRAGWKSNFAAWGKRKWGNFAVWGKRNAGDSTPRYLYDIAQPLEDKRAWSQFASWGKRTSAIPEIDQKRNKEEFQDALNVDVDKRKWSQFASWGKRDIGDDAEIDKRKWSQFAAWGKRNGLNDLDKRKWSQFASWGKRSDDIDSENDLQEADKRKWSQFASWGKRFNDMESPEKRKWSQFASWGKRDDDDDLSYSSADKRKWAQFASWGKRGDLDDEQSLPKRRWSQFASWGKRLRDARLAALSSWAKRRWTGLPAWGKRSADIETTEQYTGSVAEKLLNFFDANGDSALDKDELRHYVNTLLYISSKQQEEQSQLPVEM